MPDKRTDEQIAAYARALHEERKGYVARGMNERVAQVDAELTRIGHGTKTERRPRVAPETRTANQKET